MGNNTVFTPTERNIADVSSVNQYHDVLSETLYARDNDGIISKFNSIGSNLNPFSNCVAKRLRNTGTKTETEFLASGTFIVPDQVHKIFVVAGGAGGSAPQASAGGRGGGTATGYLQVTPGEEYSITIASGNATFGDSEFVGNYPGTSYGPGGTASISENVIDGLEVQGGTSYASMHGGDTVFASGGLTSSALGNYGGAAGYSAGADDGGSLVGGPGGGYTAATPTPGSNIPGTAGAAGVKVEYYIQAGVADPN